MKVMILLKRILIPAFIVWLSPFLSYSQTNTARTINDHLVQNLSCKALSVDSVFHAIEKEKVFSSTRQIPIKNWSFKSGPYELANCWSLSRFQRITMYLGNFPHDKIGKIDLLNMVRGSEPYATEDGRKEWYKIPLLQFAWTPDTLNELLQPVDHEIGSGQILRRHFKAEIEQYQNYRFHDLLKNFKYILNGRERTQDENVSTENQLTHNLGQNRLTLILIRAGRKVQHVVMAQDSVDYPDKVVFQVYDSNYPQQNQYFEYNKMNHHFYAPEIIRGLQGAQDIEKPVGVFIVDEKEREKMGQVLLKYYQKICSGDQYD